MPLYEYRCTKCGREFESYRRISDAGEKDTCPSCGSRAEKLGLSLFRAKGSPSPGGTACGGGSRRSPFS